MGGIEETLDALASALVGEPSAQYQKKHRARYASDLRALEHTYRGGTILEVGALPCHLTYCLRALGYPQLGVDLAPDRMNDFITRHALEIVQCDIERERLPFEDDRFDLVLMNEVFEHLRIDPITALREVWRVTRKGGRLRLTTPNLYSLDNLITFARGRGLLNPYVEFAKLHNTGHMGHFREYAAFELSTFLSRIGFRVDAVRYDSYGPSWRGRITDTALRLIPKLRPYMVITGTKIPA